MVLRANTSGKEDTEAPGQHDQRQRERSSRRSNPKTGTRKMEPMNTLATQQQELGQQMGKLLANLKKDPADRKTVNYIADRRRQLQGYISAVKINHQKIVELKEPQHEYHKTNFIGQLEDVHLKASDYLDKIERSIKTEGEHEKRDTAQEMRIRKQEKLIHSNDALSSTEKMHYLKSHVDGEAARLIQHLHISERNYETAWDIITKRYHNTRLITSKLLDKILDFPVSHKEDAHQVRMLHDTIHECREGINNIGHDTTSWGPIITKLISRKWDTETNRIFEQSLKNPTETPALEEVMEFMKSRFQSLEALAMKRGDQPPSSYKPNWVGNKQPNCTYCKEQHQIEMCPKFGKLSVAERIKIVKEQQLCFKCIRHSCNTDSFKNCSTCRYPHHSLLHQTSRTAPATRGSQAMSHASTAAKQMEVKEEDQQVLLATAIVRAQDILGQRHLLRALVDPGSQASFITEQAAQQLMVPRQKTRAMISGLGEGSPINARAKVTVHLHPRQSSKYTLTTDLIVLPKITGMLPMKSMEFDLEPWQTKILADPTLNITGPIHVLLGAQDYAKIILNGVTKTASALLGQQTELEWIVSDQVMYPEKKGTPVIGMVSTMEEERNLSKYWEMEEVEVSSRSKEEDIQCENHYMATTTRGRDGRYTVRIPFKEAPTMVNSSRSLAVARLHQLEKKLEKEHRVREQYKAFLQEYIDLGHMKLVPPKGEGRYYIPHQPVIKEASATTKLRVVFDASATTRSRKSLNQTMHVGPRLQEELADILVRWRKHPVAFTADIQKMYRQINIHEDDQPLQTILWRFNQHQPIQEYQLTTVTYGTTAAPYLATRTLQQLAKDEEKEYPNASRVALTDFYVDDELTAMLDKGGFKLHKWSTNKLQMLQSIPDELRDPSVSQFKDEEMKKSLGILWIPHQDVFTFKIEEGNPATTKRGILSAVAKIFDPLGWLAPVTIMAKLLIQRLWLTNASWDENIPESLRMEWLKFTSDIGSVEEIQIPRWIHNKNETLEIHGFCDASEKAYGAVVYTKASQGKVSLLMAKSKVAPARTKPTIPKLELCAAVLLARLIKRATTALQEKDITIFAWTDSMITLAWIKGEPSRWKTFVYNRVMEINNLTSKEQWNHVCTNDNPADLISRGTTGFKLKTNELWWNGPKWLASEDWKSSEKATPTTNLETRKCMVITKTEEDGQWMQERFSSLTKLIRVTAYCNRFISYCRKNQKSTEHLTVEELKKGLIQQIRRSQQETHLIEIQALTKGKKIPTGSKITSLNPFIDQDGVLRVGGRLSNSLLTYSEKHPCIIGAKSHLAHLLIIDAHQKTLHGGLQITLAYLRRRYWIINGRRTAQGTIRKCARCIRYKKQTATQLMGDLPAARVTPSAPFQHCGIDYAGPIQVRAWKGRGHKSYKGYIAVFVCLATRAIHLEVVSDMTTESFLAALKRFQARRGRCQHIYSDNGTNFVGASKMIEQDVHKILQSKEIQDASTTAGTQWHFIPPASPHMGGIWESGVKSLKHHMRRTIGETTLTYEELTTLVQQIEACLNSRPLVPIREVMDEDTLLTPGHFLIGRPILEPLEETGEDLKIGLSNRWKMVQKMKKEIWKAWSSEYLHNLQQRYKWKTKNDNIKINDIVLVKDDNLSPGKWPLAKVIATHPAEDNIVRVVTTQKADGKTSKKAIHQLVPLHSEDAQKKSAAGNNQEMKSFSIKAIVVTILMMMIGTTVAEYNITHPNPGFYIEHMGDGRIERGIFRIDIQYKKTRINEDIHATLQSITQFKELCNKTAEIAENSHCTELVQLLEDHENEIQWLKEEIGSTMVERRKRGILGDILTAVFGVNDEVYKDIASLNKNQQEIIRNADRQTKIMLSALSAFNETETKIEKQLQRFHRKLNEGIQMINQMSKWYRTVDENRLNLQVLSIYTITVTLANEVQHHYKKVININNGRGSLHELISDIRIKIILSEAEKKMPSNVRVLAHPVLRVAVKQTDTHIHVQGFFLVAEITEYVIMKITSIPIKIENTTFWTLESINGVLAVDYNNQQYFEMTNEEFKESIKIAKHKFVCAPTVVKKIEENPNCIINEMYNRTEKNQCSIQQHHFQDIVWKQLYMTNTWMFVTAQPTRVAVTCNNKRQDVVLNATGILKVSQDCLVQTRRNILNPKRDFDTSVLGTYIKHLNTRINQDTRMPDQKLIEEEPVLKAEDHFGSIIKEEAELQNDIHNTIWRTVTTKSVATSTITILIIISTIGVIFGLKNMENQTQGGN
ncbi:uncharacterized protein LOC116173472 [Photinus pyralis]|uniref:uncharacterized protein LOC116173472 n=1 Tax=Photinus pyralis TaxID=7054 RepID=UPI0012673037|nr:uncharacterized protein LOC116173472 [Photinus pyralis]